MIISRFTLITIPVLLLTCFMADAASDADGIFIDKVWSGHPVGFALLTERGHQFIAYYDAERRLMVAGRKLGEKDWTRVHPDGVAVPQRDRLSNVTGWDSHNRLVMALDRDGCLHVAGNMHADPLVYYRTREPFDLSTLERIDRMTGAREARVTYPKFRKSGDGALCFNYRDGGSGNGSDIYNIYDPDRREWRRQLDTPLLEGEGERSAYTSGPTLGPDGRYHLLWMWRETPDALSNNTLSYARSPDGIHWETSRGKPITLPITRATCEVIDPAKPGEGLVNMCYALGFDAEKNPVAVYHRFDKEGKSQAFVARPDADGIWRIRQLSEWDFRWDFSGNGSQAKQMTLGSPVTDGHGDLLVDFSTSKVGSGRWLLDGKTLEIKELLPMPRSEINGISSAAKAGVPGLESRTTISTDGDTRWVLRWQTLGPNRDLKNRNAPPPSDLRLFKTVSH